MQKKLLTLAVAGALTAPGLALAQVEVYGFLHLSFNKFKYSEGAAGEPSKSMWDVASHGSNVGVRGRESLGGGQTAWFQVETNAAFERSNNIANVSGFASRNSAIGFQGGWGNLFIGQWTTPWADLDALWGIGTVGGWGAPLAIIGRRETTGSAPNLNCTNQPGAGGLAAGACESVEGAGGVGHPFWRRISNSIHYQSPVFGGVQLKLAYQTNQDKSTVPPGTVAADPQMWSGSVQWAGMGGRLRVGAAIDGHKDFSTIGQTDTGWRVTGGWNFGFADIGAAYETMTYKIVGGECEAKQWGIGIAVPVGQGAIRASYAQADDIEGAFVGVATVPGAAIGAPVACAGSALGAGVAADNGAKQWNIGYDHRFSKRTTVGVGYAIIKNDPNAVFTWSGAPTSQGGSLVSPPAGSDPSTFFVSLLHRF
jgi:predicted porin